MTNSSSKNETILVYKSYGGLGDIFFTIPSLYMLKQKFTTVAFAIQPRLVRFFEKYLEGIEVLNEKTADKNLFDCVIELGNYPWFKNDSEKIPQIKYHTHKKVKQHSIEHYKDGIVSVFPSITKTTSAYPYFKKKTTKDLYYTVHPGAGFLLKAWPIAYYAKLIEEVFELYPNLTAKIIVGPDDPNPEPLFTNKALKYELITGGIDEVAEEISGAKFHIGNDAGITHLAGSFNIPTVGIYGPTGPGSWGAFSEQTEIIWGKRGNCSIRCNYEVIIYCEDRVCLTNVTTKIVLSTLLKLLDKITVTSSNTYLVNENYKITPEEDAFIFTGVENEYLIEIQDRESHDFITKSLKQLVVDSNKMPKQFTETFHAMLTLGLFLPVPALVFAE
ncbi:glycosyltransferase family 9 protein [Rasiella rasia]|uniref:Glycosyltransferase family 9 protein n=1 Tax=Rasiella rasia TaxID=2744027 RepID=A0A6G6GRX6_9FLAO|nr:glycosyltransferase family 9 protein [Rasiella rasia]QIE60461.1 glycosyltransferase family 9 protein [Rasiella rasia]